MTAALLLAIFKAIPSLEKIYLQSIDLYFKQQEAADNNRTTAIEKKRTDLLNQMKQPGVTDEELKAIRRALYDLGRG